MRIVLTLFLAGLLASGAHAAKPKPEKPPEAAIVLAERDRTVTGGRAVQLAIAQTEIATSVDTGRVMSDDAGMGGLLGSLIIAAQDNKKELITANLTEKAEAMIAPLRLSLKGFDVDALALAATRDGLAAPGWFQPLEPVLNRAASIQSRTEFAKSAAGPQTAFVTWSYDLSPDFTQVRVFADLLILSNTAAGPRPLYRHPLASMVQLRKRSFEPAENAAVWNANEGALAKTALGSAVARIGKLIPQALATSAADLKRFADKNAEKAYAAGHNGTLIERRADGGMTIWIKGLVAIEQVP